MAESPEARLHRLRTMNLGRKRSPETQALLRRAALRRAARERLAKGRR